MDLGRLLDGSIVTEAFQRVPVKRPDTYDQWEFVKFCLEYGADFYVKVPRPDPEDEAVMVQTLVPLQELTPQEWVYWVRSWYYTASTGVLTLEQWDQLHERAASVTPVPLASAG